MGARRFVDVKRGHAAARKLQTAGPTNRVDHRPAHRTVRPAANPLPTTFLKPSQAIDSESFASSEPVLSKAEWITRPYLKIASQRRDAATPRQVRCSERDVKLCLTNRARRA